jgi:hypothetical protein
MPLSYRGKWTADQGLGLCWNLRETSRQSLTLYAQFVYKARMQITYSPSPSGGFAQKVGFEANLLTFNDLNLSTLLSILNFWAKPPEGEGGVRAKQSQGEPLRFLDRHTLICELL